MRWFNVESNEFVYTPGYWTEEEVSELVASQSFIPIANIEELASLDSTVGVTRTMGEDTIWEDTYNFNTYDGSGAKFVVVREIDGGSYGYFNPIGRLYNCEFDGNWIDIKNIDQSGSSSTRGGLFNYIWESDTTRIRVNNCYFENNGSTSNSYIGGIASVVRAGSHSDHIVSNSTIDSISTVGTIQHCGGLWGYMFYAENIEFENQHLRNSTVRNRNIGGATSNKTCGGIVGRLDINGTVTGSAVNFSTDGDSVIESDTGYAGGIVGYLDDVEVFYSMSNSASVSPYQNQDNADGFGGVVGIAYQRLYDCHNNGNVTGDAYIGGIAGRHRWNYTSSMYQCTNTGDVTGRLYVGGLIGEQNGEGAHYQRCWSTGDIYSISSSFTTYQGFGLGIGRGLDGGSHPCLVWECYFTGKLYVTGSATDANNIIGDRNGQWYAINSYFDSDKNPDYLTYHNQGYWHATEAEMKGGYTSSVLYNGWTDNYWIFESGSYPRFNPNAVGFIPDSSSFEIEQVYTSSATCSHAHVTLDPSNNFWTWVSNTTGNSSLLKINSDFSGESMSGLPWDKVPYVFRNYYDYIHWFNDEVIVSSQRYGSTSSYSGNVTTLAYNPTEDSWSLKLNFGSGTNGLNNAWISRENEHHFTRFEFQQSYDTNWNYLGGISRTPAGSNTYAHEGPVRWGYDVIKRDGSPNTIWGANTGGTFVDLTGSFIDPQVEVFYLSPLAELDQFDNQWINYGLPYGAGAYIDSASAQLKFAFPHWYDANDGRGIVKDGWFFFVDSTDRMQAWKIGESTRLIEVYTFTGTTYGRFKESSTGRLYYYAYGGISGCTIWAIDHPDFVYTDWVYEARGTPSGSGQFDIWYLDTAGDTPEIRINGFKQPDPQKISTNRWRHTGSFDGTTQSIQVFVQDTASVHFADSSWLGMSDLDLYYLDMTKMRHITSGDLVASQNQWQEVHLPDKQYGVQGIEVYAKGTSNVSRLSCSIYGDGVYSDTYFTSFNMMYLDLSDLTVTQSFIVGGTGNTTTTSNTCYKLILPVSSSASFSTLRVGAVYDDDGTTELDFSNWTGTFDSFTLINQGARDGFRYTLPPDLSQTTTLYIGNTRTLLSDTFSLDNTGGVCLNTTIYRNSIRTNPIYDTYFDLTNWNMSGSMQFFGFSNDYPAYSLDLPVSNSNDISYFVSSAFVRRSSPIMDLSNWTGDWNGTFSLNTNGGLDDIIFPPTMSNLTNFLIQSERLNFLSESVLTIPQIDACEQMYIYRNETNGVSRSLDLSAVTMSSVENIDWRIWSFADNRPSNWSDVQFAPTRSGNFNFFYFSNIESQPLVDFSSWSGSYDITNRTFQMYGLQKTTEIRIGFNVNVRYIIIRRNPLLDFYFELGVQFKLSNESGAYMDFSMNALSQANIDSMIDDINTNNAVFKSGDRFNFSRSSSNTTNTTNINTNAAPSAGQITLMNTLNSTYGFVFNYWDGSQNVKIG